MNKFKLSPKSCGFCGKSFQPRLSKFKFCSPECYHNWQKPKNLISKRCSKCKETKPLSDFFKTKNTRPTSWCKECYKKREDKYFFYECFGCGKTFKRIQKNSNEKECLKKTCVKCLHKLRIKNNGGFPLNYTGTKNFTGSTLASWKHNGIRRGVIWDLTNDQLENLYKKQRGICALSGVRMEPHKNTLFKPSLDRIDSLKNYTEDNVQFVCSIVNIMKNRYNEEEFVEMCRKITEYSSIKIPGKL